VLSFIAERHLPMFSGAPNAGGIMSVRSARRAVAVATISACLLVTLAASAVAGENSAGDADNAGEKVTICHRTNSDKHPYVEVSLGAKGALKGHARHHAVAAVWSPGMKAKHEKWGDIIPTFDAGGTHFDGLNLDTKGGTNGDTTGQSILDAHCTIS
jgi:hypothetical protein